MVKKAVKKPAKEYVVCVQFPLDDKFRANTDKLESLVGRDCSGSGAGLGYRDVDWYFKSAAKAVEAFLKLNRVRWLTRCELRRTGDEF